MKFKISSYVVYSEPMEAERPEKRKRVVFSTRTCQGLVMTEFLLEKIIRGETDVIPMDIFMKLTSSEIIVPHQEDEREVVWQRRHADLKDREVNRIFILPNRNDFYEKLKKYINDNRLHSITFLLQIRPENEVDIDSIIHQLNLITEGIEFKIKPFLNLPEVTDIFFSYLISSPFVSEMELNIGDLPYQNNLSTVQHCLEEARKNNKQITFRMMVLNRYEDRLDDFFRMLSLYKEDCFLLFERHPQVERKKFAEMEVYFLTILKRLGIKTQYLPVWSPGVYSIAETFVPICNVGHSDSRSILLSESRLMLFTQPSAGEVNEVTSGETPCSECFALPVCGGASIEAWRLAGENICPSFIENLPERAKLFYTKSNGN